ncbi:MAG: TolC family protein [Chlamydiota bacterium]
MNLKIFAKFFHCFHDRFATHTLKSRVRSDHGSNEKRCEKLSFIFSLYSVTSAIAVLSICSGCYVNRALIWPYHYAPKTAHSVWNPPSDAKQPLMTVPTAFPVSEDEASTLAELIDVALLNNTSTQQTWAEARSAAAQYAQTQSAAFPTITGSYDWIRTRSLVGPAINSATPSILYLSQWGPQLALAYTIFDFGVRRATTEAAHQALFFADWTHNRMLQTVIQTVSSDFYNYLLQRQLYRTYEINLLTAKTTLDAASLGLQTGVRDLSDVLQAQTQVFQTEITVVNQEHNVQSSLAQLLTDMGLPSNHEIIVQDFPIVKPDDALLKNVEELLAIAMQERDDLLAAEANLKSMEEKVIVAKRQQWPQITYNFNYGKTTYKLELGKFSDGYDFAGTLSFSVPLFAGFYYRNGVKIAEANKEQAEAQLRQTLLQVIQDVTVAHYNVKITFEGLRFANQYLRAAAEEYDVILSQYKAGVNTITNVLSAQSSLADARAKEVTSIKDWFSSLVTLNYATGILTQSLIQENAPVIPQAERSILREDSP